MKSDTPKGAFQHPPWFNDRRPYPPTQNPEPTWSGGTSDHRPTDLRNSARFKQEKERTCLATEGWWWPDCMCASLILAKLRICHPFLWFLFWQNVMVLSLVCVQFSNVCHESFWILCSKFGKCFLDWFNQKFQQVRKQIDDLSLGVLFFRITRWIIRDYK